PRSRGRAAHAGDADRDPDRRRADWRGLGARVWARAPDPDDRRYAGDPRRARACRHPRTARGAGGGGMMATTTMFPAADPAVRRSGIGSSDAAVVAGLNRWKTTLDLYLEKRGLVEPEPASEAAEWGTILEPTILREFARRNGVNVVGRGEHGVPLCYCADGSVTMQHTPIPAAEITEAVALLDTRSEERRV